MAKVPELNTYFTSMSELVKYCRDLPGTPPSYVDPWRGNVTWEQCLDLAENGWPEGMSKASELARKLTGRVAEAVGNIEQHELTYDVTGGAFDVGSYIQGVPECWIRVEPQEVKKEVRIVINTCASAGVDADDLMKRGTAVAALVIALKNAGHPVTVDIGWECGDYGYSTDSERIYTVYTRIIDANSPIVDIDSVVFAAAHPGFMRWLMFAVTEGEKNGHLDRVNGGHVVENYLPENLANPSLYMGSAHLDQVNRWRDGGEEWVLSEYLRQTKEQ